MREILFFVLFCLASCVSSDTKTKKWLTIYEKELNIARENQDIDAWIFFQQEYQNELKKQYKND